ncbi:MAG: choice-of-anchor D domain-containing protein [Candidatus Eisenbacteria bacterium]|nr:choice-of-anchor D domain-containing protein [Candidatus Eisenbacteria bacterium]
MLNPTSIDFGSARVGTSPSRSFSVTNAGGGTIAGTLGVSSAAFLLVGDSTFSLAAGQSKSFTIRFTPLDTVAYACSVSVRGIGAWIRVLGRGTATAASTPVCYVPRTQVSFDTVTVGASRTLSFSVHNLGGGVLRGSAGISCPEFSVVSGGEYALTEGESVLVALNFAPTGSGGLKTCLVELSGGSCGSVLLTGVAASPPTGSLRLSRSAIDFGQLLVGRTTDQTFRLRNAGSAPVPATVQTSCAAFRVVTSLPELLPAGDSLEVTVRFAPTDVVAYSCSLAIGSPPSAWLALRGTGFEPPHCNIESVLGLPSRLMLGDSASGWFTVVNTGITRISGRVTATCPGLVLLDSVYSIKGGASAIIRFKVIPVRVGTFNCTLNLGNSQCSSVSVGLVVDPQPPADYFSWGSCGSRDGQIGQATSVAVDG